MGHLFITFCHKLHVNFVNLVLLFTFSRHFALYSVSFSINCSKFITFSIILLSGGTLKTLYFNYFSLKLCLDRLNLVLQGNILNLRGIKSLVLALNCSFLGLNLNIHSLKIHLQTDHLLLLCFLQSFTGS
jgi:hypothetical protein